MQEEEGGKRQGAGATEAGDLRRSVAARRQANASLVDMLVDAQRRRSQTLQAVCGFLTAKQTWDTFKVCHTSGRMRPARSWGCVRGPRASCKPACPCPYHAHGLQATCRPACSSFFRARATCTRASWQYDTCVQAIWCPPCVQGRVCSGAFAAYGMIVVVHGKAMGKAPAGVKCKLLFDKREGCSY